METKKEPEVIPEDTPKTEPAGQTDKAEQTGQTEPAPAGKPEAAPKEKPHKKNKGEAKAEALQAEIDQLKAELDSQKEAYQRMLAEYANYKRRTEQEKERIGEFTKADLLKHLLTSVDNMERALEAADGPEYKKGVDMTFRQFHETLAALGLEEIPAKDAPFNPEVHNAVMREDADGVEPDTVTEVFRRAIDSASACCAPPWSKWPTECVSPDFKDKWIRTMWR